MTGTVAIVGVGRVGFGLSLAFARAGLRVLAIDSDPERVRGLLDGKVPFIEEGAEALLGEVLGKSFFPTENIAQVAEAESIVLTLGTPIDQHMNPLFTQIDRVLEGIRPHLHSGHLIVLRSTVSPGTTEHLARVIDRTTPWTVGKDIFLAFCPERIAEGHALQELSEVPQIVGGLHEGSSQRAAELFGKLTPKIWTTDSRSAELAKLFCNMYRYIDFAIGNEFMMIARQHDREFHEIVDLINRDYKRGGLKAPGLSGGPCLYKDGFFLISRTPYTELIAGAWKINETVPAYLIDEIRKVKQLDGARVAILGLAFKKNIDDRRNSLSYKAKKVFEAEGAEVHLSDPFIPSEPLEEAVRGADVIFLAMNHDEYESLSLERLRSLANGDAVICDIWNIFRTNKIIFPLN